MNGVLSIQDVSTEYQEEMEHITGVSFFLHISLWHVSIDLWQQEKERRLRGKGIKPSIWKCCPDCRAHHHSEWYSLITLLLFCYSFLLRVCFLPSKPLFPDIIQTAPLMSELLFFFQPET